MCYGSISVRMALHIEFGVEKCQLLVSAKPGKLKKTVELLESEPDILTFYGQPVTKIENGDFYVHLGVVQAPTNQLKLAVDYRIAKATEIVYLHQGSTKSALAGVNPVSNRNIVLCYDLPTFIYGLDTIPINTTDLDRLELKYRGLLRNIQLQDTLELMMEPWAPARWRAHCRKAIVDYWISTLHESCKSYSSLDLFDVSRLRLDAPHPIWVAAGRDSFSTTQAVYQMWVLLGVYNTQERLAKMNKVKSPLCVLCPTAETEDRVHFLLSCPALAETREDFLRQLSNLSMVVVNYMEVSSTFLLCLLDPLSALVPEELRTS